MKNTVTTATIAIDYSRIKRDIYAESACIALMSPESGRPEILNGDHDRLLTLYIENAIAEFTANFCAFIDNAQLDIERIDDIVKLPFLIPESSKIAAQVIRKLTEQIIASKVLSICYETRPETAEALEERHSEYRSRLLIALK